MGIFAGPACSGMREAHAFCVRITHLEFGHFRQRLPPAGGILPDSSRSDVMRLAVRLQPTEPATRDPRVASATLAPPQPGLSIPQECVCGTTIPCVATRRESSSRGTSREVKPHGYLQGIAPRLVRTGPCQPRKGPRKRVQTPRPRWARPTAGPALHGHRSR
jgi:hypothetical protein